MTSQPQRILEQRDRPRFPIIVRTAIYVPAAVVLIGLWSIALLSLPGSWFAFVVLSLGAFPFAIEAYQGAADLLGSGPVTSHGMVERNWNKSRLMLLGRVHYLLVSARPVIEGEVDESANPTRLLFEIQPLTAEALEPGDEIEVLHWPHTNTVVSMTLVERVVERSLRRPSQSESRPESKPAPEPTPEPGATPESERDAETG